MIGLASAAIPLLYIGRALAWTWGSRPLGPDDVVFFVPIARSDDAAWVAPREEFNEEGADEKETLRRLQEWAAAGYHWWKS